MKQDEILTEIQKCKESPYYFATKYLTVKNNVGEYVPFTTSLSEEEFNIMVNSPNEFFMNTKKRKLC
jgi:hypothetical protein